MEGSTTQFHPNREGSPINARVAIWPGPPGCLDRAPSHDRHPLPGLAAPSVSLRLGCKPARLDPAMPLQRTLPTRSHLPSATQPAQITPFCHFSAIGSNSQSGGTSLKSDSRPLPAASIWRMADRPGYCRAVASSHQTLPRRGYSGYPAFPRGQIAPYRLIPDKTTALPGPPG